MTYIEREALLDKITEIFDKTDPGGAEQIGVLLCRRALREAPAADVVPVKHGRWGSLYYNRDYEGYMCDCLNCHNPHKYPSLYCPNCGSKMDLED